MIKKIVTIVILSFMLVSTAYAGTYMFNDKASKIRSWMASNGESGSAYDMLMAHFSGLSGLANGTLYDHVDATLTNLGYTGTLNDKLSAFFVATTSVANPRDAERAFWANSSYSFSSGGGGFIFVDNNNFIFIDGNNFIFVN